MTTPRTEAPGRSALLIFLAESLILPAGLIIAGVTSRALSPDGYGRYALAVAVVGGTQWLISSYNGRTVQLLSDRNRREQYLPTIFQQYLGGSVVLMVLLMLLAYPLALLFKTSELVYTIPLLSLDLPLFALCQAQRCSIIASGDYSGRAVASAARWISRTIATCLFLYWGWGTPGAIGGWLVASLAEVLAVGKIDWRGILQRGAPHSVVWREGRTMLLFVGGMRLYERIDLFLLQAFKADVRITGYYSAAQVLTIIPSLVAGSVGPVLNSVVVRRHSESADVTLSPALAQTGVRGIRAALVLLPLAAIFAVNGADLAMFAFGRDYAAAGALLGWLSLSATGMALTGIAVGLLGAIGHHRVSWRFSLPTCLVAIAVQCAVIPRFDALGAAVASGVISMATGLVAIAFVCRQLYQPFPSLSLVRVTAAGAAAAALCLVPAYVALWVPIRMAIGAVTVLAVLVALGEWTVAEGRKLLSR